MFLCFLVSVFFFITPKTCYQRSRQPRWLLKPQATAKLLCVNFAPAFLHPSALFPRDVFRLHVAVSTSSEVDDSVSMFPDSSKNVWS
ncbi:hypothetical protein BGZ57DRAFT_889162 [Hyaloscypha finlandica]|nr:hypothetical protein BGZ57DRAFT_889162 [Hyaloscypha finlandica]